MDDTTRVYGDTRLRAVSENNDFAYHRIEIAAEQRYEIDLWKDGAIARGKKGYRLKDNPDPGIEIAIEADADTLEPARERITPGRSSETSHYADLRELDTDTLEAAAETITDYLEEADEPSQAHEAVESFFEDIEAGLLER